MLVPPSEHNALVGLHLTLDGSADFSYMVDGLRIKIDDLLLPSARVSTNLSSYTITFSAFLGYCRLFTVDDSASMVLETVSAATQPQ